MVYSPTTWVDDTPPPINAANLNKMEQGIAAAVLRVGDTMTGPLVMFDDSRVYNGSGPGTMSVDGTTYSGLYFRVGSANRYFLGADNVAWKLAPFTDAGSEDGAKAMTFYRSSGELRLGGDVNLNGHYLYNLHEPESAQDAATKFYVDARTPKITSSATAPSNPAVGDIWAGPM